MQPEELCRAYRKRPLYLPESSHKREDGISAIEKLIPHRPPFLFVDRITAVDLAGGNIAGQHYVDPKDPIYRGHFPGEPILPGALQVEAIGQLGLCLFAQTRSLAAGVRALKIHHAAFLDAIRPGTTITLLAKALSSDDYTGICAGQVLAGPTICCVAVMEVYFVEA